MLIYQTIRVYFVRQAVMTSECFVSSLDDHWSLLVTAKLLMGLQSCPLLDQSSHYSDDVLQICSLVFNFFTEHQRGIGDISLLEEAPCATAHNKVTC